MIEEAANPLFSVQADKGMSEAQCAALAAILADYGFADASVEPSLFFFSEVPPWCIELSVDAWPFLRAVAGAAATIGLGVAGGTAAGTLAFGAKLQRFFERLGAVPGRDDGGIRLYDSSSRALATVFHSTSPIPSEAYATLAELPWPSFHGQSLQIFYDAERRSWIAQRRGGDDLIFAVPLADEDPPRAARRALIVTALPLEATAVLAHLTDSRPEVADWGVSTHGWFGSRWEVILAVSGRGSDKAAAITGAAVRACEPEVALFVGVAGGLKDVAHGDVVVADDVFRYQFGKQEDTQFLPRALSASSDPILIDLARALSLDVGWFPEQQDGVARPNVFVEPIVCGDIVLASVEHDTYLFLRRQYSHTVAIEQEGFGFLTALGRTRSVRGAVVRGVSDLLADKAGRLGSITEDERRRRAAEDAERQRVAARNAAAFAFALLTAFDNGQPSGAVVSTTEPTVLSVRHQPVARPQSASPPTARSTARLIAGDLFLPGSRDWQEAEARADAWSDQYLQRRDFPVPLPPKPWLVLHLVPFRPLAPIAHVTRLREFALPHLPPLGQSGNFGAEERDGGLLALPARARGGVPMGYSMIWSAGQIEGTMVMLRDEAGERPIGLRRLERTIIKAGRDYTEALRSIGAPLPIRFRFALVLAGGEVLQDESGPAPVTTAFSPVRLIRILHETLDDWSAELADLLRPQFDQLWRDAGYPGGSASYDARGAWQSPNEEGG